MTLSIRPNPGDDDLTRDAPDADAPLQRPAVSRRGWLAAGAAGAAALALGRTARAATLSLDDPDADALEYLERLETLQAEFFTRATRGKAMASLNNHQRECIALVAGQDNQHREWFHLARNKLGISRTGGFYTLNAARSRPPHIFAFPLETHGGADAFFALSRHVKELSLAAYGAWMARARRPRIAQAIAALAGDEARHLAALREVAGVAPSPQAFWPAADLNQTTLQLAEYGFQGKQTS